MTDNLYLHFLLLTSLKQLACFCRANYVDVITSSKLQLHSEFKEISMIILSLLQFLQYMEPSKYSFCHYISLKSLRQYTSDLWARPADQGLNNFCCLKSHVLRCLEVTTDLITQRSRRVETILGTYQPRP